VSEIFTLTRPAGASSRRLSFPASADGDINDDGLVDIRDVMLGRAILLDPALNPTPVQLQHGDVAPLPGGVPAPDGQFTLGDLLVIERKALGEISF